MNGWSSLLVVSLVLLACGERRTNLVSDHLADAGRAPPSSAGGTARDASVANDAGQHPPASCGGHVCACDDGKDNDGDMRIDGLDAECTGPYDDDESTFATGAPAGQNRCHDCFWDNNAGSGDDDCRYPVECLQDQSATVGKGKGNCASCTVSQRCIDTCQSRTPNGCDCFGCCEITQNDGSTLQVELTDTCSLAKLDDVAACPRCVQSPLCRNPCGHCELCPGRKPENLPADCGAGTKDAGPRYACDEGQAVCSETAPCTGGAYCELGCCLFLVQ
jgi:hypothetical protein